MPVRLGLALDDRLVDLELEHLVDGLLAERREIATAANGRGDIAVRVGVDAVDPALLWRRGFAVDTLEEVDLEVMLLGRADRLGQAGTSE